MELSDRQTAIVTIVYLSALLPSALIVLGYLLGRVPRWIFILSGAGVIACALGWEVWLTYGLVDGLSVVERRPDVMNAAIPLHINWLLNSLADGVSIGLGGVLLVWLVYGRSTAAFTQWRWGAFFVLLTWFIGQNLWVELTIYQAQLAEGYQLSWAPLIPTGPWYNPVLFVIDGRTVQLQTQLPWLLMTPLYYFMLLTIYRRYADTA